MAVLPYFIFSPNTIISFVGLLRGPDKTVPTPKEDWRNAVVDAVIPTHNEERTVILCLESLLQQTLKPRKIILMDDGSKDRTVALVEDFARTNSIAVEIHHNPVAQGKTPGAKRFARELDSDVLFVLDGDTILSSPNFIERLVQELYQGVGISSSCGFVEPMREAHRNRTAELPRVREFYARQRDVSYHMDDHWWGRFKRLITITYRDFLYAFLQRFVYLGQMTAFGSILNPLGCAVAYRREYIRTLFDDYESTLGDNLTTSEDIFIGFALAERGFRNIQVHDVGAITQEPQVNRLPKQIYMWSSSFIQSCYYFPDLLISPFRVFRRYQKRKYDEKMQVANKRKIQEAYRQAFGINYTGRYGRPIGWVVLFSLLERISFPLAVIYMVVSAQWEALGVTLVAETILLLLIVLLLAKKHSRMDYVWKTFVVTPIRYFTLLIEVYVLTRFGLDMLLGRSNRWRK